jgi:putative transposase
MYEYRHLTQEQKAQLVQDRKLRGFPPHEPPHPVRDQVFYILTAACYEHRCHMKSALRRQQILNLLFEKFIEVGMEIRAWVVLPNHYHLLVKVNSAAEAPTTNYYDYGAQSPTTNFDNLGQIFRSVHGVSSRQWNLSDNVTKRKVWFRYSDRAIRSERHYYTTLNYIHYNPVKHGWAKSSYDWVESSVHWYLEHYKREWLRDLWVKYPVRDYGKEWDN